MKPSKGDCDHMLHRYILAAALFVLLLVFVDHVVFAQGDMGLRVYGRSCACNESSRECI